MPCNDPWPDDRMAQQLRQRLSLLTRYACEQFAKGEPVPSYLKAWWRNHQQADRERTEQVRRDKKTAAKKQAALAKLTPEERQALGLP